MYSSQKWSLHNCLFAQSGFLRLQTGLIRLETLSRPDGVTGRMKEGAAILQLDRGSFDGAGAFEAPRIKHKTTIHAKRHFVFFKDLRGCDHREAVGAPKAV